ncbi:MAG: hypothetical protein ACLS59_01625 [Clostridia bacterium]
MKKKQISISVYQIFIALMVIIAIIVTVSIVKKHVPKTNRIATGKASDFNGSGTSDDPYKIENIEDLLKLSENVNSGITYSNQYFELTNKLDFQSDESYKNPKAKYDDVNKDGKVEDIKTELTTANGFLPIGDSEHAFEGIFNGNDKTIRNYSVNIAQGAENNVLVGVFGNNKGRIINLKVTVTISVDENIENTKVLIGTISAKNSGIIQTCKTEGTITANINAESSNIEVAGICAENSGKIIDTANSIAIISNQLKAGIVALNYVENNTENSGEITNCTNEGKIEEQTGSKYYTAGIVADNQNGNITSCTNNGKIDGKIVGGIVGKSTGYIVACQNTAEISNLKENSNDEEFAGGIVAILETATIENSKNTGNVIGSTNIGGIAGESKGTITQCRNDGQVSKVVGVICKTVNLGGLVGKNGEAARLSNSKNYGNVNSETDTLVNLGGICGILYNNSIVELCENNGAISGSGKEIIPNEDTNTNCASCTSNNGGSASTDDFGQLNIGIIYGKYQEI